MTHPENRFFPAAVALVVGWSGVHFALLGAAALAILGSLGGVVLTLRHGLAPGGINPGLSFVGVGLGGVLGAIAGIALYAYVMLVLHPVVILISLAAGALVARAILRVENRPGIERLLLRLRGYRAPTWRERERIQPILEALDHSPDVYMADIRSANAWAHTHSLVITTGLLAELGDDEWLGGVIAHELAHIDHGDARAMRTVWACGWPAIACYNLLTWLTSRPKEGGIPPSLLAQRVPVLRVIVGVIAWTFLWPSALLARFAITPTLARYSRAAELRADATAARWGYRTGLYEALEKMALFERAQPAGSTPSRAPIRPWRCASPDSIHMPRPTSPSPTPR